MSGMRAPGLPGSCQMIAHISQHPDWPARRGAHAPTPPRAASQSAGQLPAQAHGPAHGMAWPARLLGSQRAVCDSASRFACRILHQLRRRAVRADRVGRAVVRHQPGTWAEERTDAQAAERLRTAQASLPQLLGPLRRPRRLRGRGGGAPLAAARRAAMSGGWPKAEHGTAHRVGAASALGEDGKSVGSGRRWRVRHVPKDVPLAREEARKARLGRRRSPTMRHRRQLVPCENCSRQCGGFAQDTAAAFCVPYTDVTSSVPG